MKSHVSRMKVQRVKQGHTLETLEKKTKLKIPFWRLSLIENGLRATDEQVAIISRALECEPEKIFPVFLPDRFTGECIENLYE